MKIENPSHDDVKSLVGATTIRVNGRKYTVGAQYTNFTSVTGARGGQATLVPSTNGRRVQITTVSGQRDWIHTLEI